MGVGDKPSDQVDHEMSNAAMAAVLNLGNIFELIMNGLNKRAPAQQAFIEQRQEPIMPIFAKGGYQRRPFSKRAWNKCFER